MNEVATAAREGEILDGRPLYRQAGHTQGTQGTQSGCRGVLSEEVPAAISQSATSQIFRFWLLQVLFVLDASDSVRINLVKEELLSLLREQVSWLVLVRCCLAGAAGYNPNGAVGSPGHAHRNPGKQI